MASATGAVSELFSLFPFHPGREATQYKDAPGLSQARLRWFGAKDPPQLAPLMIVFTTESPESSPARMPFGDSPEMMSIAASR
jgi:hypothetical protein